MQRNPVIEGWAIKTGSLRREGARRGREGEQGEVPRPRVLRMHVVASHSLSTVNFAIFALGDDRDRNQRDAHEIEKAGRTADYYPLPTATDRTTLDFADF